LCIQQQQQQKVIFYNDGHQDIDVLWYGGGDKVPMGVLPAHGNQPFNSYTGHQFIFVPKSDSSSSPSHSDTKSKQYTYTVNSAQKTARFSIDEQGKVNKVELKEMTLQEREKKQNDDLIEQFRRTVPVKFRNLR
jgi:hypothetical protein